MSMRETVEEQGLTPCKYCGLPIEFDREGIIGCLEFGGKKLSNYYIFHRDCYISYQKEFKDDLVIFLTIVLSILLAIIGIVYI